MKKKLLLIFVIVILVVSAGIIYLNRVVLPVKIKALIINSLQEKTHKQVSIESLRFGIFKGLVLRNLVIYDAQGPLVSLKEGSCTFLIWPFFRKMIVIPSLNLKYPQVFLERRKDGTFNLQDLFSAKISGAKAQKFQIFVYKVALTNGRIHFTDNSLAQTFAKDIDNLNLNLYLSLPASVKFNLRGEIPENPLIKINATGEFRIPEKHLTAKVSIKDFSPGEFLAYYQGLGVNVSEGLIDTTMGLELNILADKQVNGYLDILNGIIKLEKIGSPIEGINGRLEFSRDYFKCPELNFKYLGLDYKMTGVLTDFHSPQVQLGLYSKGLSLESNFAINNKLLRLSKCEGRYLNSDFSVTGDINAEEFPKLNADINGELNINLEDIKEPLKKFKTLLERINPKGTMHAQFTLNGNINDIKSCVLAAKVSSPSISAYGLKAKELALTYNQEGGIIDIPLIHLSLYDGTVAANAGMNLNSANLPYWVSADIENIRLEKLKLDTAAKEKDIAGTMRAQGKINGFSNDLSRLNGAGNIFITDGKLWELNLFKGLGSLLFARDFASIIFSEGSCGFLISDKHIFSDNLKLKSNIAELSGAVKIGFDNSIDASLNVNILDEMVPLSGTFKDITTAIIGQSGRFGVIKISGTLKEPKYKFQPAVADIIKGLKDIFLKR
jgi:uncharacterized protein involved in outer membrane biogenesis